MKSLLNQHIQQSGLSLGDEISSRKLRNLHAHIAPRLVLANSNSGELSTRGNTCVRSFGPSCLGDSHVRDSHLPPDHPPQASFPKGAAQVKNQEQQKQTLAPSSRVRTENVPGSLQLKGKEQRDWWQRKGQRKRKGGTRKSRRTRWSRQGRRQTSERSKSRESHSTSESNTNFEADDLSHYSRCQGYTCDGQKHQNSQKDHLQTNYQQRHAAVQFTDAVPGSGNLRRRSGIVDPSDGAGAIEPLPPRGRLQSLRDNSMLDTCSSVSTNLGHHKRGLRMSKCFGSFCSKSGSKNQQLRGQSQEHQSQDRSKSVSSQHSSKHQLSELTRPSTKHQLSELPSHQASQQTSGGEKASSGATSPTEKGKNQNSKARSRSASGGAKGLGQGAPFFRPQS